MGSPNIARTTLATHKTVFGPKIILAKSTLFLVGSAPARNWLDDRPRNGPEDLNFFAFSVEDLPPSPASPDNADCFPATKAGRQVMVNKRTANFMARIKRLIHIC